jgi:hypothetical protein
MAIPSQGFPTINAPFVDPPSGVIQRPWIEFLQTLWQRTGGGSGGPVGPITPVTVTASPFSYQATLNGHMWINQGTYAQVMIQRGTLIVTSGYITRGIFPLSIGDRITITYGSLVPTMSFIPT